MNLTQKETSLLKDLKNEEQLCIEKYTKYANDACDCKLKNLFNSIGSIEKQHLNTINEIMNGSVPVMNAGGSNSNQSSNTTINLATECSAEDKQKDKYLCSDALSTEKFVSSAYNTSIFEFAQPNLRNILNHIQKEEQEHGEMIYSYMAQNGLYN